MFICFCIPKKNSRNMNSDMSSSIWLEYIAYWFLGVAAHVLPISCMITLMYSGITYMFLSMSSLWLCILIIMYDTLKDIKSIEAQSQRLYNTALYIDVAMTLMFISAIVFSYMHYEIPIVVVYPLFAVFVITTIFNVIAHTLTSRRVARINSKSK